MKVVRKQIRQKEKLTRDGGPVASVAFTAEDGRRCLRLEMSFLSWIRLWIRAWSSNGFRSWAMDGMGMDGTDHLESLLFCSVLHCISCPSSQQNSQLASEAWILRRSW